MIVPIEPEIIAIFDYYASPAQWSAVAPIFQARPDLMAAAAKLRYNWSEIDGNILRMDGLDKPFRRKAR